VFIYQADSDGSWIPSQTLTGATNSAFGVALAVAGNILVVGAYGTGRLARP
jgi:cysteine synthase